MNATRSYDPETGRGNYTGMNFHWYCEALRSPPLKCPILSNSSSDKVAYLDTGKLQVGEAYRIKIVISKDTRDATAVQLISIIEGRPPQISIR